MKLRATALFAFALSALVLSVAGCGGDSSTAASEKILSKAEFAKQATAICEQTKKAVLQRVRTYVREHPESLHIQPEIARDRLIIAITRSLIQKQAASLAALHTVKSKEEEVDAIAAAIDAGLKKAEEDPNSTVQGTYREANKLSAEYGLSACDITL